ncbi:MAG TPA: trehalase family glycosidase, partial [Puia sp.]|nr:trehalase family glycosidase [Puia sp.]
IYSSLRLRTNPVKIETAGRLVLSGITYGDSDLTTSETWTFIKKGETIQWSIERSFSKSVMAEESAMPAMNFDDISTWEGAYQGYGGVAWFYLFNRTNDKYGVHTASSDFWSSKFNKGLRITVDAPDKKTAMSYTRTLDSRLSYAITVSDHEMLPLADSGTHRRRFVSTGLPVWAPFPIRAGRATANLTFSCFDFREKYGRGTLSGIDSDRVNAVLNTIARIGVIDSLHFGGNSWHTPYGPICLHEQYIAQLGLGIDDPAYLRGYQSCLDFYRDHAILPDGRVYPRWAYTNEDAMAGRFNKDGFYEARWGILMDSNPDYVSNVADLFDLTGDSSWVKGHRLSCEKALDWILRRDGNANGLVEMMTDNRTQKQSSDWIDIIWASYENAFVNAKLYHALVKWATIEKLFDNPEKALHYEQFAAKLKSSFNKSTEEGGFWDEEKGCYIHWRDKDNTIHGRNMVTPVNFMAIAYNICDDPARKHRILDAIETKMRQENLFFWPLTMSSYAPDEGKEWQFPFPSYENGDLFLSWGSIGIAAYADYNPDIALKYVKNVLAQYAKDGLAFQRYGRLKQDGLGDDILAGNSLSIVGLFQSIYGVNPLYNRLYLDPHITPELAGTVLKYNFHNLPLTINLDTNTFAVSNDQFKVISKKSFGFNAMKDQVSYFNGADPVASLDVTSDDPVTIAITAWNNKTRSWKQITAKPTARKVKYVIRQLTPNSEYIISIDKRAKRSRSDKNGDLLLEEYDSGATEYSIITPV